MKRPAWLLVFAVFAATAMATTAKSQETSPPDAKHTVQLKPRVGQPCVSRVTIDRWMTMTILDPTDSDPDATRTTRTRRLLVLRLKGGAPDENGDRAITVSLLRVVDEDHPSPFDTDNPPEESDSLVATYCGRLVGVPITMKIGSNGIATMARLSKKVEQTILGDGIVMEDDR